jgi:hypothetical protein
MNAGMPKFFNRDSSIVTDIDSIKEFEFALPVVFASPDTDGGKLCRI